MFNKITKYYHADIALRYLPISDDIKRYAHMSDLVLEVGSGATGITPYIPFKITGADICFRGEISENVSPVKLSDNKLPFQDDSYNFVICVDMLEHVHPDERPSIIKEMLRVCSRRLYIEVPCGKKAAEQDKMLDRFFQTVRGYRNAVLKEHVDNGLPAKDDIAMQIRDAACSLKKKVILEAYPCFNLTIREFIMKQWISPFLNQKRAYYMFSIFLCLIGKWLNSGDCYRQLFIADIVPDKREETENRYS